MICSRQAVLLKAWIVSIHSLKECVGILCIPQKFLEHWKTQIQLWAPKEKQLLLVQENLEVCLRDNFTMLFSNMVPLSELRMEGGGQRTLFGRSDVNLTVPLLPTVFHNLTILRYQQVYMGWYSRKNTDQKFKCPCVNPSSTSLLGCGVFYIREMTVIVPAQD